MEPVKTEVNIEELKEKLNKTLELAKEIEELAQCIQILMYRITK